jgi:hypothetical protein
VCASIELHPAYHVDSISLADGSYQLIPEPEGIVLKTLRTSSGDSLKARTKVQTLLTWLTPAPPVKASPGHNLLFYYTAIYIYLRILCIKFLGIAWNPSCISLGTNVLNISTWIRLAAMLIGPVEVGWFPVTRAI